MDLGSPVALLSVCAVLTCLLGAARVSSDENSCPCPDIPIRNDSLLPPTACHKIDDTFRYTCKEHTVRKAGTSNLIKCKIMPIINGVPRWSNLSLQCIPDPKRTTKQPPKSTATTDPKRTTTQSPASTVTKGHTDIPHDFTIATTVTAAPSRETESLSPAASVSAEPTSPGLQAPAGPSPAKEEKEVATETEATQRTTATSTAAEPSDDGTPDAHTFPPAARTALISCALVVIVCALIGISFLYYKRRPTDKRQKPQSTKEEEVALNNVGPKQ